jgi:Trk K+ transport system NAD-binding subunit
MRYRPKRELPAGTRDHVLIFGVDAVTRAFVRKLEGRHMPFVVVTSDQEEAFRLESEGMQVLCGTPTDGSFLEKARAGDARGIVTNLNDPESVNLCLTARKLGEAPIAVVADDSAHADLLRLAGATHVIPLPQILGRHLATRATTFGAAAHVLDAFGNLLIAEMPVFGTPFIGQTLGKVALRERTGLSVIGLLERGAFSAPRTDSALSVHTLMLLAGTREQMSAMERLARAESGEDMVFILGHGRIGCAAATVLGKMNVAFTLIDSSENPFCGAHEAILGDATRLDLLRKSGINNARGLIITTNDDNTNIFLVLASRHANPHVRIVARANREENVDELYAAGADFVVSNASVGANFLANVMDRKDSIFLTEGVNVFRRTLPPRLTGWTVAESGIGSMTGCAVVALLREDSPEPLVAPPPETVLDATMDLVLIGTPEQEKRFSQLFPSSSPV